MKIESEESPLTKHYREIMKGDVWELDDGTTMIIANPDWVVRYEVVNA